MGGRKRDCAGVTFTWALSRNPTNSISTLLTRIGCLRLSPPVTRTMSPAIRTRKRAYFVKYEIRLFEINRPDIFFLLLEYVISAQTTKFLTAEILALAVMAFTSSWGQWTNPPTRPVAVTTTQPSNAFPPKPFLLGRTLVWYLSLYTRLSTLSTMTWT